VGKEIFPKITLKITHILQQDHNNDGKKQNPHWIGNKWCHTADTLNRLRFGCMTIPKQ
jgi:hypothetical protein